MKRIFQVTLSKASAQRTYSYEVVAETAEKAIVKARGQARRDMTWRGAWLVEQVLHRGTAV
jgi:hypothetical protein